MLKKIIKTVLFVILGIPSILISCVLLVGIILGAVNYTGFCISEGRFLSDQEKIDAAIKYINDWATTIPVSENGKTVFYKYVKNENIEEFKKENPNCCIVGIKKIKQESWPDTEGGVPAAKIINRMVGGYGDAVGISFLAKYRNDKGQIIEKPFKGAFPIGNCGHIGD